MGDTTAAPEEHTYTIRQDVSQDQHLEGLPFGTLGGARIRHTFPLDGEYELQVRLYRSNLGMMRGLQQAHPFEMTLDGARVHAASVGGPADLEVAFEKPTEAGDAIDRRLSTRVRIAAGPRDLDRGVRRDGRAARHHAAAPVPEERARHAGLDRPAAHSERDDSRAVRRDGPGRHAQPPARSSRAAPARACPRTPARAASSPRCCVAPIGSPWRRRTCGARWRCMRGGRREGTFETGIQRALQFVLASPKFVFRAEREPAAVDARGLFRVSDIELASRLSFFLWSSIPDDELLDAADAGRAARSRPCSSAQVRRMLADPRSNALVDNFVGQWLQLRNLRSAAAQLRRLPRLRRQPAQGLPARDGAAGPRA